MEIKAELKHRIEVSTSMKNEGSSGEDNSSEDFKIPQCGALAAAKEPWAHVLSLFGPSSTKGGWCLRLELKGPSYCYSRRIVAQLAVFG